MRSVYYHLKKGISTQEFVVAKIDHKEGSFSWGSESENIIYSLGPQAHPLGNAAVKQHWDKEKH